MEVAPEDREILTLNTHRGLYRPNRLMYGIASATAIWQRQIETILQGIEGVSVFLDDIKITGSDQDTHLRRLEEVLQRLSEWNIRVNRSKCEFFADVIEYCGYMIDKEGIHKIRAKVEAINGMTIPKNKEEVRSFVGLINYYGRFFKNLSTVLYPLNNLLKKDVPFVWTKQCEESFRTVKLQMQSKDCLVHYSPELPLALAKDASPYGVGAVLSHLYPDGTERPIQFASQTLTSVQQGYMEVDKEAYAILFELNQIETLPIKAVELAQATAEDQTVRVLVQGIKYRQDVDSKDRFGVEQTEFSLQKGCLLRGIRVYAPQVFRKRVLEELHSTHFGITCTKSLARGYCWWIGMDRDIETMIADCAECQSVRSEPAKTRLHYWETPTLPFQRVHVDFAGPFMDTYFFILVDSYSKWPEIKVCKSITAESTVNMCRQIFSTFGIPSVLVSDHGVQFTSEAFQNFLRMNGIIHKMGAPYHPSTNGQAERYVQTFKQKLKALKCSKSMMNTELSNILLMYRKMLHPATGQSPSMQVFGRQIRSRLDLLLPKNEARAAPNRVVREFKDGDRVRDFLSHDKWKFGRIVEKTGKLRYIIRIDDGRIWERHIDHMVGVGENLREDVVESPTPAINHYVPVSMATNPVVTAANPVAGKDTPIEPAAELGSENASGTTPVKVNQGITTPSRTVPGYPERPSTMPIRRSNRIIKHPQKLNL
ncbi:uncharacterized protein K02A2.6-like [Topomyia yanbarensis]|uniref:uncharacterized protein K02A2.6-like n=1 Tax=Topomyia yanbarensis TaxID=2498891 RepID=UPI00273AC5A2|nr:uncharacterized protein K02A2.6-like [Topomyia yanbarensis]